MQVITESQERTVTTPVAVMTGLAAPSQGSTEVSTWRVRMNPDAPSPMHVINRDQVWMPLSGSFEFTVGDEVAKVAAGQALVVPGGSTRQFHAIGETAEAIVCMLADGQVGAPGSNEFQPIPWAI